MTGTPTGIAFSCFVFSTYGEIHEFFLCDSPALEGCKVPLFPVDLRSCRQCPPPPQIPARAREFQVSRVFLLVIPNLAQAILLCLCGHLFSVIYSQFIVKSSYGSFYYFLGGLREGQMCNPSLHFSVIMIILYISWPLMF